VADIHTSHKILIVEDDPVTQKMVSRMLTGAGYVTSVVSNGVEALEQIVSAPPDLIVSDVMMPEMDGFTLLYALRGNPQTTGIPIIMLTARNSGDDILDGLDMGANDYIPKPFDPETLIMSVRENLKPVTS